MEIKDMVKKAVDERNEKVTAEVERRVKELVQNILHSESQILYLVESIAACKKELKSLELPKPVTVEL